MRNTQRVGREAVGMHRAFVAHLLRLVDLHQRVAGGPYREEEIGVGVATDGGLAPRVVRVRKDKAGSRDGHFFTPL